LTLPLKQTSKRHRVFTRLPDKQLTERSFIEPFTGQYDLPGSPVPVRVSLHGDHTIVLTFPGSPDIELLPKRGTAYDLKDQSGVSIEFKPDLSGKITEAAVNDNGTVMVLKKK
jgi:hypothetical protein